MEARFQRLQKRRRHNPKADDPLFRPIDADDFRVNGEQATDYSNLRQNGLIRVVFALPPNMRLIDPATNAPSDETNVDVWRMVPGVTDVKLTGPDGLNPWPRGPNHDRAAISSMDDFSPCRSRRWVRCSVTHRFTIRRNQRLLDDLSSFQRVLFTNERVRALSDAIEQGVTPLPDADPRAQRAGTARQDGLHSRVRAVPRRPGTIDAAGAGGTLTTTFSRSARGRSIRLRRRGFNLLLARRGWLATREPTKSPCRTAPRREPARIPAARS